MKTPDTSPTPPIVVGVSPVRERKRRQRELWLAAVGLLCIVAFSWIELRYVAVDSYLFLILFNINFLLLLLTLYVVGRNVVKLVLDRRRRVLGSRLRSRLVLAFMTLSLVPSLFMFLLSINLVQTGIDYWFKSRIDSSMEQSLEVGQEFYATSRKRLGRLGRALLDEMGERQLQVGQPVLEEFLAQRSRQHGLGLLGVLTADGAERSWQADATWQRIWPEVRGHIDLPRLVAQPTFWSSLLPGISADMIVGLVPMDPGGRAFLVLGETVGRGLMWKLDQIVRGVEEYKKLASLKQPLKMALYMSLGVITASLILGSLWFGFRLAKELSAPVQALAQGTQRIADGDLTVRLEDESQDELGFLVQSFNRMVEQLREGQAELRQANLRLADQNRELGEHGSYMEAVLNNITSGVVSVGADNRVSTVNRAAEAMLGIDANSVLGGPAARLLPEAYRPILADIARRLAASPDSQWQRQIELSVGGRDARFLVNVVALKTVEDGVSASHGMVAVFEDITELDRMQRLAAWREVAKRIAHEIKNPLTPIKLSAQRLQKKFGLQVDDPAFAESTDIIVRHVEHMQAMVQEFSAFAKLPEVTPVPADMAPLVEEVVGLFRHSHSHIRWELEVAQPPGLIRCDLEALRRVVMNLLTNAAESLGQRSDGQVSVRLERDEARQQVRIQVTDNGPGLNPEERARLFEPYFSSKKGGTGLGLTIARSLVADHHGRLRVRANTPRGAVFTVELPVGDVGQA